MTTHTRLSLLGLPLLLASSLLADRIDLKDGRTIDGTLLRTGDKVIITPSNGPSFSVLPAAILRVTLTNTLTPDQKAQSAWSTAQVNIKRSDSLTDIIKLHEKILLDYQDTPTAALVADSLGQYQKYASENRIKFRGNWISTTERQTILRTSSGIANAALNAYHAGNLPDTIRWANEALKIDDQNTLSLTLLAMVSLRQSKDREAKIQFTTLTDADPANVLALNNLAILAMRVNADPEALRYFGKALQTAPDNRLLLDNIAEALNMYQGPTDTSIYIDLARNFTQADIRMQSAMAEKNLYRFGGTWVSGEQRDAIARTTTDVIAQANNLQQQYQVALSTLSDLQNQYNQAQADYNNAVNNLLYLNNLIWANQTRGIIDPSLPGARDAEAVTVNAIARHIQDLSTQIPAVKQNIDAIKAQADQLKPALAAARSSIYSGVPRIMEPGDVENPPAPLPINAPRS